MTVNRGLWVPINTGNVGTTDLEARLADNALFESNNGTDARSGLLNPQTPAVVTGTANMSYNLAAVNPVINRAAAEGVYRFSATGVTNLATTAAPAANSRIDVIWVKQNDQTKADANNFATAGVAQGGAAASPTAPAIPAGAMEVARATVGANITATTAASITQTFRYTSLRGTPTPVRSTLERTEITSPRVGQLVKRLDLAGTPVEEWNGSAWVSEEFSAVNTADANWTYRGGLWRDSRGPVPKVCLTLLLTRTGGTVNLTATAIQAFAALIPAGWRPVGHSVSASTVSQTSGGADKWGIVTRISPAGDLWVRTDTGSSTILVNEMLPIHMEWVQ